MAEISVTNLNDRGFDNLGATEDDGSNYRPDFVISIQPQQNENVRAALPVSTLDWRSTPRGQFIPVHGLDFLIGVSTLQIQQTVELDDLIARIDSENRYIVRVPNGESLYLASEMSSQTQRCLCGSGRAFVMHLHDNTRQEAMQLQRRLAAASCCFPCRLQEMKVITPPGDYIGRVQQQCTWMVPFFLVRDAHEQVLFAIEGPAVRKRSALMLSEFKIMTGDSLREVGKIAHGWDRDLVSFTTTLSMPNNAVQPRHKALLLAAVFLMEHQANPEFYNMYEPHCEISKTIRDPTYPYYEYYLRDKDEQNRRQGTGQNCWTGAQSMEWHIGRFVRDTMHGLGDYRWRYRGEEGVFVTYEGYLYMNQFHGYGAVSYPDGKVFTGLFKNDVRYGPGVETFAETANVGLWRHDRLIRLAWRPEAPSVAPVLHALLGGKARVDPHRNVFDVTFKTIGKVNPALELLKQLGSDPVAATENWTRLYPVHCTDKESQLCHVDLFDKEYYRGDIYSLKEQGSVLDNDEELYNESQEDLDPKGPYYAWNNDKVIIDMMKHCYRHERQRKQVNIDLTTVLSGPRSQFKRPAMHELDSRTLLMACYLGHVASTTYLVNDRGVDPNIADMLGNTAVMYAACGDQPDLINFLVEAGANVDSTNDSCCTALGIALVRLACAKKDILANAMAVALTPPPFMSAVPPEPQTVFDWHIRRAEPEEPTKNILAKSPSKLNKTNMKIKSLMSVKPPLNPEKKSTEIIEVSASASDEDMTNEEKLYRDTNDEYITKVTNLFDEVGEPVTYLFELRNMVEEMNIEQKKTDQEKIPKKRLSKVMKETTMPSKDAMWHSSQKIEDDSQNELQNLNAEKCDRIELTILRLLAKGANPKLAKCPQPALFLAIVAGCPDLIGHLVRCGADVNEVYSQHLHYTPLDIAISQPLNQTTLGLVRELLAAGARADRRLRNIESVEQSEQELPGPTLLHVVLATRVESDLEDDIRKEILHLLLEYGCDPLERYCGRSALDEATKNLELLGIIVKNPTTNLNAAIDDTNQTILVKMFHMPYFKSLDNVKRSQMLTDLLLFGADPLLECEYEGVKYANLFVLVKKILDDFNTRVKPAAASKTKINIPKGKKPPSVQTDQGKGKKEPKKEETSTSDDVAKLTQAINLMTECSRIIYIRWLQTQLAKELIRIIQKVKHRHWSMIIKEHPNKKASGLWLTAQRCLEVWGHLKSTEKKRYNDETILRHLLCMSYFYHQRSVNKRGFECVTSSEKDEIESYVSSILKDSKKGGILPLQGYVQPELFVNADSKFNVCFECFLPLTEDRILCKSCKFVSFCNMDCLMTSIEKCNGHACNYYLILQYLPNTSTTVDGIFANDSPHLSSLGTKEPNKKTNSK